VSRKKGRKRRRKPPMVVNPNASAHVTVGAPVEWLQTAEHQVLGAVSYSPPRLQPWRRHFERFQASANTITRIHARLQGIQPGPSGARSVDPDTTAKVYLAGSDALISAVLAVQHLAQAMEFPEVDFSDKKPADRIGAAANLHGIDIPSETSGWQAFNEVCRHRHKIEHPTNDAYHNYETWDEVPMAWLLSERPGIVFRDFDQWFSEIVGRWPASAPFEPATVESVNFSGGAPAQMEARQPPQKHTT
jgi:hypothetical protein